jgi:hypothetical protein
LKEAADSITEGSKEAIQEVCEGRRSLEKREKREEKVSRRK